MALTSNRLNLRLENNTLFYQIKLSSLTGDNLPYMFDANTNKNFQTQNRLKKNIFLILPNFSVILVLKILFNCILCV